MIVSRNSAELNRGSLAAALAPIRDRLPGAIVEREILRVVSAIPAKEAEDIFKAAQDEVLKWARKRAGGALPEDAWRGLAFEMLAAGRTTMGACIETDSSLLWGLRGDDPDKNVPGRIWSTEISLGQSQQNKDILVGVRLIVNSNEAALDIEPAVPGLLLQISDKVGLADGPLSVWPTPHYAETEYHADMLVDWLLSGNRKLPIIVATGDERSDTPDKPLVDVESLAKALCGLAHVVSLPSHLTYKISDIFGKSLGVFHGGVRIYNTDFDFSSESRDNRLYLGNWISSNAKAVEREIRSGIARDSLRRTRLGRDVIPFASVRSASLKDQQSRQIAAGASDQDQLVAANTRNEALQNEIAGFRAQADQALELSVQEADRAEDAEKQLAAAWSRIELLESALKATVWISVEKGPR